MSFDFLGFLRLIRGFSTGYEDSKEKNSPPDLGVSPDPFLAAGGLCSTPCPHAASRLCFVLRRCNREIENHQEAVEVFGVNFTAGWSAGRRAARPGRSFASGRKLNGFEGAGHSAFSFRMAERTNMEHIFNFCKRDCRFFSARG
jgi:hypothetical protein